MNSWKFPQNLTGLSRVSTMLALFSWRNQLSKFMRNSSFAFFACFLFISGISANAEDLHPFVKRTLSNVSAEEGAECSAFAKEHAPGPAKDLMTIQGHYFAILSQCVTTKKKGNWDEYKNRLSEKLLKDRDASTKTVNLDDEIPYDPGGTALPSYYAGRFSKDNTCLAKPFNIPHGTRYRATAPGAPPSTAYIEVSDANEGYTWTWTLPGIDQTLTQKISFEDDGTRKSDKFSDYRFVTRTHLAENNTANKSLEYRIGNTIVYRNNSTASSSIFGCDRSANNGRGTVLLSIIEENISHALIGTEFSPVILTRYFYELDLKTGNLISFVEPISAGNVIAIIDNDTSE